MSCTGYTNTQQETLEEPLDYLVTTILTTLRLNRPGHAVRSLRPCTGRGHP